MGNFIEITPEHDRLKLDICAVMSRYDHIDSMETMAILSQIVGALIAVQDEEAVNPQEVIKYVLKNIEIGNASAVQVMITAQGSA